MPLAARHMATNATSVRPSGPGSVSTPAAPGAANTSTFLTHCLGRAVRQSAATSDGCGADAAARSDATDITPRVPEPAATASAAPGSECGRAAVESGASRRRRDLGRPPRGDQRFRLFTIARRGARRDAGRARVRGPRARPRRRGRRARARWRTRRVHDRGGLRRQAGRDDRRAGTAGSVATSRCSWVSGHRTTSTWRCCAARPRPSARRATKVATIATTLASAAPASIDPADAAYAVAEGLTLGAYQYLAYKTKGEATKLRRAVLLGVGGRGVQDALRARSRRDRRGRVGARPRERAVGAEVARRVRRRGAASSWRGRACG